MWGVRKACAEVFMSVSCVCSTSVRRRELSPIFINLLRDQSRWVRMAAFQALGPFISTFADPSVTALLHNDNGEIIVVDHQKLSQRFHELEEAALAEKHPGDQDGDGPTAQKGTPSLSNSTTSPQGTGTSESAGEGELFNDFFYWREPVAEISLDDLTSGLGGTCLTRAS